MKTVDLCREHGISAATFYGWKSKFGGMEVSEARRLKALEEENRRFKLLVAELSLHGEALKGVIRKSGWSLPGLRGDVAFAQAEHGLSERTTTARPRSSTSPSKGSGPWPGSLRQPQPATQLRKLQL